MAIKPLTPELLAASLRGIQRKYLQLYEAAPASPYASLFETTPSNSAGETYPARGATPAMSKFTGTVPYSGVRIDGFYVTNDPYVAGIQIAQADIERDRLGIYTSLIQEMAEKAKAYPGILVAGLMALTTSASYVCWDNKPLISTTHGKDKGASQSNKITGSGADTTAHVLTDISQAIAAGVGWKDDKGDYLPPVSWNTAIYPAANYTLGQILDAIRQNRLALGTEDRSDVITTVIAEPRITGNTWYLASGGGGRRPLGFQLEKDATPVTTYDQDTLSIKLSVELRGNPYMGDWTKIVQVYNA